jgi:hypothetical protein
MTTKNTKTNIILTPAEVMAIDLKHLQEKMNAHKVVVKK